MDIYKTTLKLKKYIYKGNNQLVKINDGIEISGLTPFTILKQMKNIKTNQYSKFVEQHRANFLFDNEFYHTVSRIKPEIFKEISIDNMLSTSPDFVNTKQYWQFLHENFQYCDVCSYYKVNDLQSYFAVKGPHYIGIIEALGIDFFKNKKILEIGPGYGYLPKILKEHTKHTYYCADIVRRFDHDNFIDVDGYTLSNITDKFDIIIMQDVIQHLGQNVFKNYTTEIKSMLNDNGSLIIGTELRSEKDYVGIFFAQSYHSLGVTNLEKHMIETLGFKMSKLPLRMVNRDIGTVYKFDK